MAIKPPWFDPHTLVGTTLQGYHLASFVGEGGFGAVYRTLHSPVLDMRIVKGPAVAISTHIITVGAGVAICVPAVVVAIQILRRK